MAGKMSVICGLSRHGALAGADGAARAEGTGAEKVKFNITSGYQTFLSRRLP
jgi:hypothetical protein